MTQNLENYSSPKLIYIAVIFQITKVNSLCSTHLLKSCVSLVWENMNRILVRHTHAHTHSQGEVGLELGIGPKRP